MIRLFRSIQKISGAVYIFKRIMKTFLVLNYNMLGKTSIYIAGE